MENDNVGIFLHGFHNPGGLLVEWINCPVFPVRGLHSSLDTSYCSVTIDPLQ